MSSNALALQRIDRHLRGLVLVLALGMSLLILGRYELANGFSVLPGDRYDAVISATILEHWYNVFSGAADWSQVKYFYPYTRTIAQTDAYLLVGVLYAPFRWVGLDPFLAQSLAGLTLKAIGFVGMFVFSRRTLSISFGWAVVAAILFTLSNGVSNHSSRVQVATIAFVPILAGLSWSALLNFWSGSSRAFMWAGTAAAGLFGALCLSSFYVAWSFGFFAVFFAIALIAWLGPDGLRRIGERLRRLGWAVLVVVGAAVASLAPFVYAFWVKAQEVGVRPLDQVVKNVVVPAGILQVGNDNLLFGRIYNYLLKTVSPSYQRVGEYYNTGISPLLFVFFMLGLIWCFRRTGPMTARPWRSMAVAVLVTWFFVVNWWGFIPWVHIYNWFPGARALNVVSAYQFFLAFPVVAIAVKCLAQLNMAPVVAAVLSALLIVGELNVPYLSLHRAEEVARIAVKPPTNLGCEAFYVSGWRDQETITPMGEWANNMYAHNVTAMMIAQQIKLPTVNGIASFNPKDWAFGYPERSDYEARVASYAMSHGIGHLCKLDLNTKEWARIDLRAPRLGN